MHELGWLHPSFFDDDTVDTELNTLVLEHSISRYHAFLNLMAESDQFLVPSLDIDLVWHTHQLNASAYAKDTRQYIGYFVHQ